MGSGRCEGCAARLIAHVRRPVPDRAFRHHQGDPSLGPDLLYLGAVHLGYALDEVFDPIEKLAKLLIEFAVWSF